MSGPFGGFPMSADDVTQDYAALGFFISQCSLLETTLHMCIKKLLRIRGDTARLLVGEPRFVDLLEMMRKVAALRNVSPAKRQQLDELLKICTDINKVRQVVAHKPVGDDVKNSGTLIFTNSATAKSTHAVYFYECTREQLSNLGSVGMYTALSLMHLFAIPGLSLSALNVREQLASRQKLPLPTIPQAPPPPKPPKQGRQPRPSQA